MYLFLLSCQQVLLPSSEHSKTTPAKWKLLLEEIASPSGVNYTLLQSKRDILDEYMSWLSVHGPYSNNYSIRDEKKKICFYANAYNAAVLYGVLHHWPINSVRDVDVGWFTAENTGFFIGQTFVIDGDKMSLFHLEQDLLLGQFQDPRIHAMLNCASRGCPPLRYWEKNTLDSQLESHWTTFIQNNVRKNTDHWKISELFKWYEKDLVGWSKADSLCSYLAPYLAPEPSSWMMQQAINCSLDSFPYDWSLNDSP